MLIYEKTKLVIVSTFSIFVFVKKTFVSNVKCVKTIEFFSNTFVIYIVGAIDYYYGTKLRYAAITVNTTINDADIGYIKGLPLRNRWDAVISGEVSRNFLVANQHFLSIHCAPRGTATGVVFSYFLCFEDPWTDMAMIPYCVCNTVYLMVLGRMQIPLFHSILSIDH